MDTNIMREASNRFTNRKSGMRIALLIRLSSLSVFGAILYWGYSIVALDTVAPIVSLNALTNNGVLGIFRPKKT